MPFSQEYKRYILKHFVFADLYCPKMMLMFCCDRIMDVFLCDGIEIIFRVALTLLTMAKHELLHQDIEGVIKVKYFTLWIKETENIFSISKLRCRKGLKLILMQSSAWLFF